jgi:transporter family protein
LRGGAAATGEHRGAHHYLPAIRRLLVLSGIATGVSWLAYFRALQLGQAWRVSLLDKLSLPLTIVLAVRFWANLSVGNWAWASRE